MILDLSHHVKGLLPALRYMRDKLGVPPEDCLEGSGLSWRQLQSGEPVNNFDIATEFRFARRLLRLSGDPALGLGLGRAYTVDSYGLFGYAFLSAATLRHAMTLISQYGLLTFTLFKPRFHVQDASAMLEFAPYLPIPDDLQRFYSDRDISASLNGGDVAMAIPLPLNGVRLIHNGGAKPEVYSEFFDCPVEFNSSLNRADFSASLLETPMPGRDAETASLCQQQCQRRLAILNQRSGLAERVRQLLLARPGFYPDEEYVAEKLAISTRSLRRKLNAEQKSYRALLGELRYEQAQYYLGSTALPVDRIADTLGYSSPGNFSYAFKQWSGVSPRNWREQQQR